MKIDKIVRQSPNPIPPGMHRVAAVSNKTSNVKKHKAKLATLPCAFARTRSLFSDLHLVILADDATRHGIPYVTTGTVTVN
jgi:hypothetical protein